jgi:hypothetical protein
MVSSAPSGAAVLVCVLCYSCEVSGFSSESVGLLPKEILKVFRHLGNIWNSYNHHACHDIGEILLAYQNPQSSAVTCERSIDGCCMVCGPRNGELRHRDL